MVTLADIPADVTLQDLLDAGVHFGHQTKRWNPKMKPFVFDKRNGIHIIDLVKSLEQLEKAKTFVHDTAARGKTVLFVGTKKQAQQVMKDLATECNQPYVTTRPSGEGSRSGHEGMGLGVFIAKTLLEKTGALITFENGRRGGAVVSARWPRGDIEAPVLRDYSSLGT